MIRVSVSNLDRLVRRIGADLVTAIDAGLAEAGDTVVKELRANSADTIASGAFAEGWTWVSKPPRGLVRSVQIRNTAPHAAYTEYGRAPGKPPPFNEIASWAYLRGITSREVDPGAFGRRAEEPDAQLDGETLSVGRRKTRAARAARRQQYRFDAYPRPDNAYTDYQIVRAIVWHIAHKGTQGKFVMDNAEMRARMLRITRDKIRKHVKHLTRAGVV